MIYAGVAHLTYYDVCSAYTTLNYVNQMYYTCVRNDG